MTMNPSMFMQRSVEAAYKFTGKERDSESGLDSFGARYMSSSMRRFVSADPITVTPGRIVDPQQLNLYAYVKNNRCRSVNGPRPGLTE